MPSRKTKETKERRKFKNAKKQLTSDQKRKIEKDQELKYKHQEWLIIQQEKQQMLGWNNLG